MDEFDDIIDREYTGVKRHKRMSMKARAAQFAPFAALTGHDAAIAETGRTTSSHVDLSADEHPKLSRKIL